MRKGDISFSGCVKANRVGTEFTFANGGNDKFAVFNGWTARSINKPYCVSHIREIYDTKSRCKACTIVQFFKYGLDPTLNGSLVKYSSDPDI